MLYLDLVSALVDLGLVGEGNPGTGHLEGFHAKLQAVTNQAIVVVHGGHELAQVQRLPALGGEVPVAVDHEVLCVCRQVIGNGLARSLQPIWAQVAGEGVDHQAHGAPLFASLMYSTLSRPLVNAVCEPPL